MAGSRWCQFTSGVAPATDRYSFHGDYTTEYAAFSILASFIYLNSPNPVNLTI